MSHLQAGTTLPLSPTTSSTHRLYLLGEPLGEPLAGEPLAGEPLGEPFPWEPLLSPLNMVVQAGAGSGWAGSGWRTAGVRLRWLLSWALARWGNRAQEGSF